MKQSGKHSSASDKFLVEQCLMQDPNAWATLASLVRDLAIKSLLGRYPWSPQDIDDVVQQTNLALISGDFRILRSYDANRARLRTFLAGVLTREALRYARRHFGQKKLWEDVSDINVSTSVDESVMIWDVVQRELSGIDALILRLSSWGYRSDEIADILSRSQGRPMSSDNVRKRRERARKKLRLQWNEKNF